MEKTFNIIWRSIIVGVSYTFTTFFLSMLLVKSGIPYPQMNDLGMNRLWFLVSSITMGFVLGAISQIIHTSKLNHIMLWTILLFLNSFSVTLESGFLAPQLLSGQTIPALMLVQFIASLLAALLITFLFASSSPQRFGTYIKRPWSAWVMRISVGMGAALLLYYFLGATNYHLLTTLYNENYQIKLALPSSEVIFAIEFMRAFLIILSLLPMIMTVGASKRFIAIICGITLVVVGSVSPFLQVTNLPIFLFLASSGKILLQNFLIGGIAGLLLGNPSRLEENNTSMIEFLRPILREYLAKINDWSDKIPYLVKIKNMAASGSRLIGLNKLRIAMDEESQECKFQDHIGEKWKSGF